MNQQVTEHRGWDPEFVADALAPELSYETTGARVWGIGLSLLALLIAVHLLGIWLQPPPVVFPAPVPPFSADTRPGSCIVTSTGAISSTSCTYFAPGLYYSTRP